MIIYIFVFVSHNFVHTSTFDVAVVTLQKKVAATMIMQMMIMLPLLLTLLLLLLMMLITCVKCFASFLIMDQSRLNRIIYQWSVNHGNFRSKNWAYRIRQLMDEYNTGDIFYYGIRKHK